jgi:hypothetical protein
MANNANSFQADGKGRKGTAPTPQRQTDSDANKQSNVRTADKDIRKRPVETSRKPAGEKAPDEDS